MSNFPICLNIEGQLCVVIGGGRVAERKVRSLLACGGLVKVISPALSPGLRQLLAQGAISWKEGPYREGDLEQGVLVVAATDDTAVQVQAYREARSRNVPINVADKPAYCTFTLPAVVRRGDLTIAIATNGKSPALAKRLRMQLEESFGTEYELLLAILGEARRRILGLGLEQQANEELLNRLLHPEIVEWVRERKWSPVRDHVRAVLGRLYDESPGYFDELFAQYPSEGS